MQEVLEVQEKKEVTVWTGTRAQQVLPDLRVHLVLQDPLALPAPPEERG